MELECSRFGICWKFLFRTSVRLEMGFDLGLGWGVDEVYRVLVWQRSRARVGGRSGLVGGV